MWQRIDGKVAVALKISATAILIYFVLIKKELPR